MNKFKFELEASVKIKCSEEQGTIMARAEYRNMENQYYIRYQAADGRAVEAWWGESAVEPVV